MIIIQCSLHSVRCRAFVVVVLWLCGGSAYGWIAILHGLEVAHSTQDFWAPSQGDVVLDGIQLNKGAHELLIYGWEYCCDSDASGKLQPTWRFASGALQPSIGRRYYFQS